MQAAGSPGGVWARTPPDRYPEAERIHGKNGTATRTGPAGGDRHCRGGSGWRKRRSGSQERQEPHRSRIRERVETMPPPWLLSDWKGSEHQMQGRVGGQGNRGGGTHPHRTWKHLQKEHGPVCSHVLFYGTVSSDGGGSGAQAVDVSNTPTLQRLVCRVTSFFGGCRSFILCRNDTSITSIYC